MQLRKPLLTCLTLLLALTPVFSVFAKDLQPGDLNIPDGFDIQVAQSNLTAPTMVAFDDQNRMIIVESGYGNPNEARVSRIEPDGTKTVLASKNDFGDQLPVTATAFHNGKIYIAHGGTISVIEQDGKVYRDLITGLPGQGDHQVDQIVFRGSIMYFGIGTMTNSGVVGNDDYVFGWLKNQSLQSLHDIPCQDITLNGQNFESENALDPSSKNKIQTGAYSAYGQTQKKGAVVKGNVKCNGAILRANDDGSSLQVFAWGFRNPYGLVIGPDDQLYVTMHGFDARGSRPIENASDCFYKVSEGQWYGFPDFACDVPVTDKRFTSKDRPAPQFLLAKHPTEKPPVPIAKFTPHSAINGFDFAPSNDWGKTTDAFIAEFGDLAPVTGLSENEPEGVKVVRVDTTNGQVSDFITNKIPGQASKHNAGGFDHPSAVTFGPDGSMYITDWGAAQVTAQGLEVLPGTGAVWRVVKSSASHQSSGYHETFGFSVFMSLLQILILSLITWWFTTRKGDIRYSPRKGAIYGLIAAGTLLIVSLVMAIIFYRVPWFSPVELFNLIKITPDVINFKPLTFLLGLVLMFAIMTVWGIVFAWVLRTDKVWRILLGSLFFGMTVWSLMQYLILPRISPLIIEKTFPPSGFLTAFIIYGLTLGYLFSRKQIKAML